MYSKKTLIIFIIAITSSVLSQGQFNDAGLWTSINIEKKISSNFSFSITEELRMNENITEAGTIYTDAGITYKVNKFIRLGGNYRFIEKRKIEDYYSKRHRYYFDLTLRNKIFKYTIQLRSRFQSQYADIFSNEKGKIAEDYFRNKLSVKYEYNKKISAFASYEIYTPLRSYDKVFMDNYRINAGLEYSFNKFHSIDLSYLFQKELNVNNPETDYIICIGYNINF